ncbi:MAG: TAT-variant-translocated molybdopterin oxidoreductase [Planctomycetia bacterium]|nr:TAT-variant-translocated molybdopterin oxidoreductase [Planctomycetia bacterium]
MSSINKMIENGSGKTLWRSLEDYADTPEFRELVHKEFPNHAPELFNSTSRRHFLKVMGASVALAGGLAGCRWPREAILPHTSRPEGQIPGVPEAYASCWEQQEVAEGVLVTSFDGRPIRVDGNGDHPACSGTATSQMQASVLNLYDPGRSKQPSQMVDGKSINATWDEAMLKLSEVKSATKIAMLAAPTSSLPLDGMRKKFMRQFKSGSWHEWAPLNRDSERLGTGQAFGSPQRPVADLSKAKVLACFDADPLMTHPANLSHSAGWAAMRLSADDDEASISRVYVVESSYSITGGAADIHITAKSSDIPRMVAQLAKALEVDLPSDIANVVASAGVPDDRILKMAADLKSQGGNALVMAGDRQPPEVHALVHAINVSGLGAVGSGKPLEYAEVRYPSRPSHLEDLELLATRIKSGELEHLIILGANPVYDAPKMSGETWKTLISEVPSSIHLGEYKDETGKACAWHMNTTHFLEQWGACRSWDGTITLQQPLIEPLYAGRSSVEFMSILIEDSPRSDYNITREILSGNADYDFEESWRKWIHDGFIGGTSNTVDKAPGAIKGGWGAGLQRAIQSPGGDEIVFLQDHSLFDGRYANNGWLQELPDPMTKVTWDNCAIVSPKKANSLGVKNGDMLKLVVEGIDLQMPAFVLPGQNEQTIAVSLGYGRLLADRAAGRLSRKPMIYQIADGVGFDTYKLRSENAVKQGFASVTVSRGDGEYVLATTQDHNPIRPEAFMGDLQREAELDRVGEFARTVETGFSPDLSEVGQAVKDAGPHHPPLKSLFPDHEYKSHKWAMSIDLNVCTGCSACVIACQAENNISVVGKDEVATGREMHWMRIDRYFRGEDVENPEMIHQPMTCNQCENAPCEQVCPVAATVHNEEGLNDMVYNRCIGTRYCSNNCPYKVRRFNYYNNTHEPSKTEQMGYNPTVTIRGRGVMEKCTYCVQRINKAKISAHNDRRDLKDGDVVPACAQTCPTSAISFGDLSDPESQVAMTQKSHRSYKMLAELNVRPRTSYLAQLKNPGEMSPEGDDSGEKKEG